MVEHRDSREDSGEDSLRLEKQMQTTAVGLVLQQHELQRFGRENILPEVDDCVAIRHELAHMTENQCADEQVPVGVLLKQIVLLCDVILEERGAIAEINCEHLCSLKVEKVEILRAKRVKIELTKA